MILSSKLSQDLYVQYNTRTLRNRTDIINIFLSWVEVEFTIVTAEERATFNWAAMPVRNTYSPSIKNNKCGKGRAHSYMWVCELHGIIWSNFNSSMSYLFAPRSTVKYKPVFTMGESGSLSHKILLFQLKTQPSSALLRQSFVC